MIYIFIIEFHRSFVINSLQKYVTYQEVYTHFMYTENLYNCYNKSNDLKSIKTRFTNYRSKLDVHNRLKRMIKLLSIFVTASETWAITCYSCNSYEEPKCSDPFDKDATGVSTIQSLNGYSCDVCATLKSNTSGECSKMSDGLYWFVHFIIIVYRLTIFIFKKKTYWTFMPIKVLNITNKN